MPKQAGEERKTNAQPNSQKLEQSQYFSIPIYWIPLPTLL
jgi:hypothetical protein